MYGMHSLADFDLNLLRVLGAVLETRHVTRAARRLGLSQSAVSHALARLRAALGDELLVRGPDGLVPTERGAALLAPVQAILQAVEDALAGPAPFDPATAERTFRVAAADYAQFVLLPPLLARLAAEAPQVNVWVAPTPEPDVLSAALASGELDLVIGVSTAAPSTGGLYTRTLFSDAFVCVVREGHPTVDDTLTLDDYLALPHAFIAPRGRQGGAVDSALAKLGRARRIALAVPHFLVIPHAIAGSDLIVTLAARVAHAFAEPLGLRILPPPLPLPSFEIALTWHERRHRDPGHAWLREALAAISASLSPAPVV